MERGTEHIISNLAFFFTAIITKSEASRMHLNYSVDVVENVQKQ